MARMWVLRRSSAYRCQAGEKLGKQSMVQAKKRKPVMRLGDATVSNVMPARGTAQLGGPKELHRLAATCACGPPEERSPEGLFSAKGKEYTG